MKKFIKKAMIRPDIMNTIIKETIPVPFIKSLSSEAIPSTSPLPSTPDAPAKSEISPNSPPTVEANENRYSILLSMHNLRPVCQKSHCLPGWQTYRPFSGHRYFT